MKKIIIGSVICAAVIAGICLYSPTTKYALKGNISKIENAVQLKNAVEILEAKNNEMQEQYVMLSAKIYDVKRQKSNMQRYVDVIKVKPDTELNRAKLLMFTNGIAKTDMALARMENVKSEMKSRIIKHRAHVDLLKAKLTYLNSLKTLNTYLKDMSVDGEFGDGVNSIVEQAIAEEEAMSESLTELSKLKTEIEQI